MARTTRWLQNGAYQGKAQLIKYVPHIRTRSVFLRAALRPRSVLNGSSQSANAWSIQHFAHAGLIVRRSSVRTVQPELSNLTARLMHASEEPLFSLQIQDAVVVLGSLERLGGCIYAIVSPGGDLLEEVSYDFFGARQHRFLQRLRFPIPERLEGKTCVILEPNAETYGHWVLEMLPRLLFIREKLGADAANYRYLIAGSRQDYQVESLRHIGVPDQNIHWAKPGHCYEIADALVPSFGSRGARNLRQDLIQRLRVGCELRESTTSGSARRIYVERGKESFRRVLNEMQVIDLLRQRGFAVVNPRNYSFREKVELFSSATVAVGVVSSGLANAVFMPKGSKVIEIAPPDFVDTGNWILCDLIDVDYYCCTGRGRIDLEAKNRCSDVVVDLDLLEKTLDMAEI
ncbi:MAG TPA: glycosyltransferase 61 family protein [Chthoniobacterales bacterium]